MTKSPLIGGPSSKSDVFTYTFSRAFIPPWSSVMTKPETLGPDISYQGNRNPSFSLHLFYCFARIIL
ncbi:hypothetical protein SAMN05216420_1252 [Nitrosospira sp. Nl5]|nr:hypothetical protein SAMN05216420_1252 [Nitrosospira sp. Nl5]